MPLPHDLCSLVHNAFRSRRARVAVPHSTQNLAILNILLRSGFIASVTRGTVAAPDPAAFLHVSDAQKRIWAELKYRDDLPVLTDMQLVSKPSNRVFMGTYDIRLICSGRRARTIKPLGMGEIAIVKTEHKQHEWLEAREALALKLSGEVICRAW
jgi:ribosomal protein S8